MSSQREANSLRLVDLIDVGLLQRILWLQLILLL